MKILFVSDQYYPLGGGIEQYLRGLSRQLTTAGHKVTHLTASVKGCPEQEIWPEGEVIRTPLLSGAIPNPQTVLDKWPQLVPVIESINPEVVYANHHTSLAAIKACKKLSLPVIYACHGWGLLCPLKIRFLRPDNSLCYNQRSLKSCFACYQMMNRQPEIKNIPSVIRRFRWLSNRRREIAEKVDRYNYFQDILENADARIVLAKKWLNFFTSSPTAVIPLGLDCDKYFPVHPEPFLKKYGLKGPYVLVSGRIHNTKGQNLVIKAMAKLPKELKLVLAGNLFIVSEEGKREDNPHALSAGKLIQELDLKEQVIFTGFLSRQELVQAYSGALVTLVPSVWLEPFASVTIEAMACVCPVIVTENSGSAEFVTDGVNGFIISRLDPEAIAKAVLKILPAGKELGQAARRKVLQDLNWSKIGAQVLRVFEMVAGKKVLDAKVK